jgi:hypothetical protein
VAAARAGCMRLILRLYDRLRVGRAPRVLDCAPVAGSTCGPRPARWRHGGRRPRTVHADSGTRGRARCPANRNDGRSARCPRTVS